MKDYCNRTISYDCRYFLGDRPCLWHKQTGVLCQCEHYRRVEKRFLLIKLDAMGDVLRTTCLLPALNKASPGSTITWITRPPSVPLLQNNPFVQEILPYGPDALVQLAARRFDRVVNLDAGKTSAALAAMARADEKVGYVLDERGFVTPTNTAAADWLRMGIFDDLKKQNRRTYQEVMCSILGLPPAEAAYVLEIAAHERAAARRHLEELGIDLSKRLIGIHTGGGERWRWKQWHSERFKALAEKLSYRLTNETKIVLFGGPSEREVNREICHCLRGSVFDAGCDNTVRHFAALLSHCAVALSGDTLAMHVALAVGCRVVTLFGPTSNAEIELFGRGEKVVPDMDCLVCYKQECDFSPNCMDLISVEMVQEAVLRQLNAAEHSTPIVVEAAYSTAH